MNEFRALLKSKQWFIGLILDFELGIFFLSCMELWIGIFRYGLVHGNGILMQQTYDKVIQCSVIFVMHNDL